MKKVKTSKGFIIAETSQAERLEGAMAEYLIFTKEEWSMGAGFRTEEWEAGSITEALEFIKTY